MNQEVFYRLGFALFLGMLIGLERVLTRNDAGMRTYGLVSMGSALFMIIALDFGLATKTPGETLRVLGQIVTGIGFLGAGLIFFSRDEHRRVGITSAATIWTVSGIGCAVGMGYHALAGLATVMVLFTLIMVLYIERIIENKFGKQSKINQELQSESDK